MGCPRKWQSPSLEAFKRHMYMALRDVIAMGLGGLHDLKTGNSGKQVDFAGLS